MSRRSPFIIELCALGVLVLAISVASRSAQAYPFYIDAQGGGCKYLTTGMPMFNGAGSSSNLGLSFNLGMFYTPIEPRDGFDFQVGIEDLFLNSSQAPYYYSTNAPYATVRVQLWMAYASVGISPFLWQRTAISPGFDAMGHASNTLAYLGELGFLYSATPKFSMGTSLNLQWFSTSGVLSTLPAASVNFVTRFYFNLFGIGNDGPGSDDTPEYHGWRYIGK